MIRTAALGCLFTCVAPLAARAQDTVRVSVDSAGAEAGGTSISMRGAIADGGNGLLVVFSSSAKDLVPADSNGKSDIFLRDVAKGTTQRIVLDLGGGEPDGDSSFPQITPDGRFVAFISEATDLVKSDKNDLADVFVLDRKTNVIERVSVADDESEADGSSFLGGISDDGLLVAFHSGSDSLVANDGNLALDVFVRNRGTSQTICVSRNGSGDTGDDSSFLPCTSGDGTRVAFESRASDLVANDGNGLTDVFVHDLTSGITERGSVNAGGVELDDASTTASLTADGALLAFVSAATNLHRDAANGVVQTWVRDLSTGEIWLASRGLDGLPADNDCRLPTLFTRSGANSPVDRVAFWSSAGNLADNGVPGLDAYVIDFRSGLGQCVSVDSDGNDSSNSRGFSFIAASPAGDAVVFASDETQLVSGDGNAVTDVFLRGLQWTELVEFGTGLAGTGGYTPRLTGRGGSCESDHWTVEIVDGLPQAPGLLWVGFGRTNGLPLFGGTFYVDFAQPFFAVAFALDGPPGIGGAGGISIDGVNVENLGQFSLYLQCTFLDVRATKRVSLSNALEIAIDA